jgi:hypothetical protein
VTNADFKRVVKELPTCCQNLDAEMAERLLQHPAGHQKQVPGGICGITSDEDELIRQQGIRKVVRQGSRSSQVVGSLPNQCPRKMVLHGIQERRDRNRVGCGDEFPWKDDPGTLKASSGQ